MPKIVFGTDGWRARIAEEYTYDAVRVCANGVAEWVKRTGEQSRGVVIGFDRRFSSEFFADAAAEVVTAHGTVVPLGQTRPLQAEAGGRVTRVGVQEGEPVSAGQASAVGSGATAINWKAVQGCPRK